MDAEKKLVFAPWGAGMFGEDVLLFEHGLLFAMETAAEAAGGMAYADIHAQVGGTDKRERPVPPLTEAEVRALATRAGCDVLIDGMLSPVRDPDSGALAHMTVSPRLFLARVDRFEAPDSFTFSAFTRDSKPERLGLDYEHFLALQFQLCAALFDTLGRDLPPNFDTSSLRITPSWDAYLDFLRGKRVARTSETKLGYYEQALRHDPTFFLALYNSAMLYKTQTDYHSARSRLLKAASATDDPALLGDTYFELGLCSIYLGDPKTARNFWERALEYGVENPSLYVNMAGTYEQEENLPEAIRLNEEALERFPDHHKAVVNLARLHAMRGQLDQAIPLYERALELQPEDALRHSVLGGCYLAAGREDEARQQFTEAVRLDPTGDPGKYARQELENLGVAPDSEGEPEPKKKRWGLF